MAGARLSSSTPWGAYCVQAAWRRRTWGRRQRAGRGWTGSAVKAEESLHWQFCKPEQGSQSSSSCHCRAKTREINSQIHSTFPKSDLFEFTLGIQQSSFTQERYKYTAAVENSSMEV